MARYCCTGFDALVEKGTIVKNFGSWVLRAGQDVIYLYFCPCCGEEAFDSPKDDAS